MRDRDSGPPREGGRSTSSAHLRRVTWSFSADIHVSRYVSEKDTVRMLACVSHIQKALSARYMAEPTKITITRSTKMNIAVPHEARFMNICGKITHISPYKGVAKERREERGGAGMRGSGSGSGLATRRALPFSAAQWATFCAFTLASCCNSTLTSPVSVLSVLFCFYPTTRHRSVL